MKTSQSSKRIIDLNLPRLYLALAFDSPWSRDALVSNLDVPLSMEVGAWWLPVSPWPARSSMDSRDPGGVNAMSFWESPMQVTMTTLPETNIAHENPNVSL